MLTVVTYRFASEMKVSRCYQEIFDKKMSIEEVKDWCQKKIDHARVWRIIDCTFGYYPGQVTTPHVLCYKRD